MSKMKITKILVANRSEIAIRVFRAANELGIKTVAVFAKEDRLALHRFKADEAYEIGRGLGPIEAYLNIDEMIRVARDTGADAIHPGYGFLSESPEFAEACQRAGLVFIGPAPLTMRQLGNKVSARQIALAAKVPVMPASDPLPEDPAEISKIASDIGFPLMLKASWGGGGRGMRVIEDQASLLSTIEEGRREARAAFGKDEIYLEKLVTQARHVEVQILGDQSGQIIHLFERDCSVQKRNQKVVERAPAPYLSDQQRAELADYAVRIARQVDYVGAGTVEFLMDLTAEQFYFIEVNPRIQVEHTVTEEVTGIDIVKAQIAIMEGSRIGGEDHRLPVQSDINLNGHALQCRITTEDPQQNFMPDYGRISAYRGASGFGIRLDGGTAYAGAIITRYYDSLLEKVTAWAPTAEEARLRMDRALREYRIRGVATNVTFLENIISHPDFIECNYTTRFIDQTPALFEAVSRRDRATKLLTYIADVSVNGHPETKARPVPQHLDHAIQVPEGQGHVRPGTKQRLDADGPVAFSKWLRQQPHIQVTDTTMRDGHQSLLATRMRTHDMVRIAQTYAEKMPDLFSVECWGGATFDVAMRFLSEDPWERLALLREKMPNILLQMLLRGSNAVGYTNYPDNVVRYFIQQAAHQGIDLFRIFDCLNWVENMRLSIDAVLAEGKLCEGTICYTGDLFDRRRGTYNLDYYVDMARQLENAGVHIIGLKDMAGLLKPAAATTLIKALRETTRLPVHFHTHDTSGIAAATILAAVDAGVDAVDAACDAFSGLTSQPCLGSLVEALTGHGRDSRLDPKAIREISFYWEKVRHQYQAFESDLRSGASEVYLHEMPGGQFTNLKQQARALGLENRWHEVAQVYADVNMMFGDIVKVTPSSKVVGDMALMMVSQDLTVADVENPGCDVAFPESVVQMMRGELGQPPKGWPAALQAKILKGETPFTERPGARLKPANLAQERSDLEAGLKRAVSDTDFASHLMYPKIFQDFAQIETLYGPVSKLPTSVYFYGLKAGEEIACDLEQGKTLIIRCLGIGDTQEDGFVKVFFELNGQPRTIKIADRAHGVSDGSQKRAKADNGDPCQIGAPVPGTISAIAVQEGQKITSGDLLISIEAMKMETDLRAERDGIIEKLHVSAGMAIDAKDLLVTLKEAEHT